MEPPQAESRSSSRSRNTKNTSATTAKHRSSGVNATTNVSSTSQHKKNASPAAALLKMKDGMSSLSSAKKLRWSGAKASEDGAISHPCESHSSDVYFIKGGPTNSESPATYLEDRFNFEKVKRSSKSNLQGQIKTRIFLLRSALPPTPRFSSHGIGRFVAHALFHRWRTASPPYNPAIRNMSGGFLGSNLTAAASMAAPTQSINLTASEGVMQSSLGRYEIEGLDWKIMRVEAQIKWAKVEIKSMSADELQLVVKREIHVLPKLERIEERIKVAQDFLNSAHSTPADFNRTRELFSRAAIVKELQWMGALGNFLCDIERLESMARMSINKETGRDFATREAAEKEPVLANINLSTLDHRKRLQELCDEYDRVKRQLACHKKARDLRIKDIESLSELIENRGAVMLDIEKEIDEVESTLGAKGLFDQVIVLLRLSECSSWTVAVRDREGNVVEDSKVYIQPNNFFRNLLVYMSAFLREVTLSQRKRYIDLHDRMLAALGDPHLPGDMGPRLWNTLNHCFQISIGEILNDYKAEVAAGEAEMGDVPVGAS
ncbi:hypothetical protein BKA65DRAFT_485641 [Rhexocercosporidium sp. MPI-PUGE-AT-0058]|nr:hypothetical protein BKA65DRAFT_485641 [Rhexocercosporidium sp. MPI-PUGE-AT-0058]